MSRARGRTARRRDVRLDVTLVPDGGQSAAVALDGRGGALVAWSPNGRLGLAERTADPPVLTQVPAGAGEIADGPDVAFTGPGQAIVVWAGTDGAVHALSRSLGGATVSLPDLAPVPATGTRTWMRPAVHAVVACSHVARTESQTTTHIRASALAAGGSFGPVEDLGTASSDRNMIPTHWSGSELTSQRVVASGSWAADVLFTQLHFQAPPGEVALGGKAATRTMSGWAPTHASGVVDGPHLNSCMDVPDVAAGSAGDALYVEGFKPNPFPR
jgi:hypothetical protein